MRVALEDRRRIGQLDLAEHRERALARLAGADAVVDHRHLHELPPDRHDRVEAAHRILIDHRDAPAAHGAQGVVVERRHVASLEEDAARGEPAGAAEVAHDRERHRRFAATGFPDEAEGFTGLDGEAEAGNDIGLAGAQEERDPRVLESENGGDGISHVDRSPGARSTAG